MSYTKNEFARTETILYTAKKKKKKHFLTMYGMPHAWLLWWQALLWGHYTTHSCHWGSSHMGLTRSWCKTLVTRKLGLHLFLLAGTTHRTNIQTKEILLCPFTVQKNDEELVPMLTCPDFRLRMFKFRIIL